MAAHVPRTRFRPVAWRTSAANTTAVSVTMWIGMRQARRSNLRLRRNPNAPRDWMATPAVAATSDAHMPSPESDGDTVLVNNSHNTIDSTHQAAMEGAWRSARRSGETRPGMLRISPQARGYK